MVKWAFGHAFPLAAGKKTNLFGQAGWFWAFIGWFSHSLHVQCPFKQNNVELQENQIKLKGELSPFSWMNRFM